MLDDLPATAEGRLADAARRLAELARELGHPDLADTIRDDAKRRLDDGRVRIVVLGEIKHGKSSLINALLGAPLLPVGVTPTTGAVVVIRVDPDAREGQAARTGTFLLHADGTREPLERQPFEGLARGREVAIAEPTSAEGPSSEPASEAEGEREASSEPAIEPAPRKLAGTPELLVEPGRLPAALELIDTPGFNDIARFRAAISRSELPRADVLVLVLDATQVLSRSELGLIRDAIAAVGGLGESGARIELVINRIDLVPEDERPRIITHLREQLATVIPNELEPFSTDAKTALRNPEDRSAPVRAVEALRERLFGFAGQRREILPARARAAMLRHARLLGYNATIQARALLLERAAISEEIARVERVMSDQARDLAVLRKQIEATGERVRTASEERQAAFRRELEEAARAQIQKADLATLTQVVPGAIQDAFLEFVHGESERLRGELEELTREVFATHGDLARRRLIEATLPLGFRGPGLYVEPPALLVEVGTLALGLVGTILWYFGSAVTGMVMTVASPLATVILREKSVRDARVQATRALPEALDAAVAQLGQTVGELIERHGQALDEHLMLADRALGEQLVASLRRAEERLAIHEARQRGGTVLSGDGAEPVDATKAGLVVEVQADTQPPVTAPGTPPITGDASDLPPEVAARRLRERVTVAARAELSGLERRLRELVRELEGLVLAERSGVADEPTVIH